MENKNIVVSSNKRITKYSSGTIKRGLELATSISNTNDSQQSNSEQADVSRYGSAYEGLLHLKKNEDEQAIKLFEKSIAINPLNYRAWFWRGVALQKQENYKDATSSYNRAIEINPDSNRSLIRKAEINYILEQYDKAYISIEKVRVNSFQENGFYHLQYWHLKGQILYKKCCYQESLVCYQKLIKIDSDNTYATCALLKQGSIHLHLKNFDQALFCWEKVTQINSDCFSAWYLKGLLLYDLKKYEQSLENLEKAVYLNSKDFKALFDLGSMLLKLKQYNKSVIAFDKAIAIKPNHCSALLEKSCALFELEKYRESIICCNSVIRLKPGFYKAFAYKARASYALQRYTQAFINTGIAEEIEPNCELIKNLRSSLTRKILLGELVFSKEDKIMMIQSKTNFDKEKYID